MHEELENINIITFVTSGSYDIGYEINKNVSMKIRRFKSSIIGMFEVSFHRRSNFMYRSHSRVEGFFIRKRKWHALGSDFPDHFEFITRRAFMNQVTGLSRKMNTLRDEEVNRYQKRSDYHSVLVVRDLLGDEIKKLAQEKLKT